MKPADSDSSLTTPSLGASGFETSEGVPTPTLSEEAAAASRVASTLVGERARRWAGILTYFFTSQALVQASGLVAGLLFVNLLPETEFALYTLASSALVTLVFLTDLGSSSSLLHFFHRSKGDAGQFAPFAEAVFSLRRLLFLVCAPVVVSSLFGWGWKHAFSPLLLILAVLLSLLTAWFQISGTLSVMFLRLESRYHEAYRAEIVGALLRLALAGILAALACGFAVAALATALAGASLTALFSRKGRPTLTPPKEQVAAARKAVLRYLAPTLPGAVYFALQGQFVVWISAAFGGTSSLAQVGALGRLGLLMGIFGGLIQVVFLPRLVQLSDERLFRRRYIQFGSFLAALASSVFLAALVMPRMFLMILGPRYAGLQHELLLVIATASVNLLGGYAVGVNNARSWNRWQPVAVLSLAATQGILALTLPLGSTAGALWFGLASATTGSGLQLAISGVGFVRPHWVRWAT